MSESEYRPKKKGPTKRQLAARTETLNVILRYWFHHLTALERLAVMFIYDRTLGWNKEWETITIEQFTKGVFGYCKDTDKFECFAAPFTRDRTRAQNVLKGLVEKGVIFRREIPNHPKGMIEYSLNIDWRVPPVPVPKRVVLINRRDPKRDRWVTLAERGTTMAEEWMRKYGWKLNQADDSEEES